jgi:RHS repeat-associated protein
MLKHISIVYACLMFATNVVATVEPTVCQDNKGSQAQKDISYTISDPKYPSTFNASWESDEGIRQQRVYTVLTLEALDEYAGSNNQETRIRIEATGYYSNGTSFTETRSLIVVYNSEEGTEHRFKQQLRFDDVHKLAYKIVWINNDVETTLPRNVKLSACVSMERVYNMPISALTQEFTIASNTVKNTLQLTWDEVQFAEAYDLEWTFVNSYVYDDSPGYNGSNLNYDFQSNSTRVTVSNNNYELSNIFGKGYVLFRIRPVGKLSLNSHQLYYGKWNCSNSNSCAGTVNNYDQYFKYKVEETNAHRENLNWNYSATYAEEGKHKEVINYVDGLSYQRQSVTLVPSIKEAVATENVYDVFGRPFVQIMPAPTGENKLDFYPNLNVVGDAVSNHPVHFSDFIDENNSCGSIGIPLATVSGASRYYSPETANDNPYTPDAKGFVYSQIEYTSDKTGRASKSAGPGEVFKMGNGKEQSNMYGQPLQVEIDRLFGSDVGHSSHYKKSISRDANGQSSISYVNLSGKTIATSLIGAKSVTMDAIPSYPKLGNDNTIVAPILNNRREGNTLVSNFALMAAEEADYLFYYDLVGNIYQDTCSIDSICYQCPYELVIDIQDACGNRPVPAGIEPFQAIFQIGRLDLACELRADTMLQFTTRLTPGEYVVSKTLRISEESIEKSFQKFIDNDTCIATYGEFLEIERAKIDKTKCEQKNCENDCEELRANGASISEIMLCKLTCLGIDEIESIRKLMINDMSPGGQYALLHYEDTTETGELNPEKTVESYCRITNYGDCVQTPSVLCLETQGESGPNEPLENGLLAFTYNKDTLEYFDEDGTPSKVVLKSDEGVSSGDKLFPYELSADDFVRNWRASWTSTLFPAHPEYDCYEILKQLKPSNDYQQLMILTESYEDAMVLGFFNPMQLDPDEEDIPVPKVGTDVIAGFEKDPFYSLSNTETYRNEMLAHLRTYFLNWEDQNRSGTYTLWELAAIASKCKFKGSQSAAEACHDYTLANLELSYPQDGDFCVPDDVWTFFRGLYISKRQEHISAFKSSLCDNSYIGEVDGCYYDKEKRFIDADIKFSSTTGFSMYSNPSESQTGTAYNDSLKPCQSTCIGYVSYWLTKLEGCLPEGTAWDTTNNPIHKNFANKLVEICIAGCDPYHYNGSTSIPPNSAGILSHDSLSEYRTFEEVLDDFIEDFPEDIFGITLLCDMSLINAPMPYDYSYTEDKGFGNADICTCDKLMAARRDFDDGTNIPGDISNLEEYLVFKFGVAQPKAEKISCLCEQAYVEDSGNPYWSQGGTWSAEAENTINAFVGPLYPVDQFYSCQPCYPCSEVAYHYNAYYDKINDPSNPYNIADLNNLSGDELRSITMLLLNKMTIGLDILVDVEGLDQALKKCAIAKRTVGSNDPGPQAYGVPEVWDEGDVLPPGCFPIDLNVTSITTFVDRLIKQKDVLDMACLCDFPYGYNEDNHSYGDHDQNIIYHLDPNFTIAGCDQTYQYQEEINGVYYGQVYDNKNNECTLELFFPNGDAELSQIIRIVNLRPYYTLADDHTNFIAEGVIGEGADNVVIRGSYSCLPLYYCQEEPCVKFSGIEFRTKEDCIEDQEEIAEGDATLLYLQYIETLIPEFREAYLSTCLSPQEENYEMTFTSGEHHYTLYYYDQAGNLIKTVPPEGVEPIAEKTTLDLIDHNRDYNVNTRIEPTHRLATWYEYNSLNQLVRQYMPDHIAFKDAGLQTEVNAKDKHHSQRFWYDALGRLVASQSAKQATMDPPRYSYTKFDALNRLIEVGELASDKTPDEYVNSTLYPDAWTGGSDRYEVVKSYYDNAINTDINNQFGDNGQEQLRNRIATVGYYETFTPGFTDKEDFDQASHYSYDIHGNIKTLIQDIKALKTFGRYKRLDYTYDLINGNVKHVAYQKGEKDQFFHKYAYDEDNRIVSTQTSKNGYTWDTDASYEYYQHGPLLRTELGDKKVQGIDYAYTLQGWLKTINGFNRASGDIGRDYGNNNRALNDAFSMGLRYYDNDYTPVGAANGTTVLFTQATDEQNNFGPNLYNGNIKQMAVNFLGNATNNVANMQYAYKYDQLNRLKAMKAFGIDSVDGQLKAKSEYATDYVYDANGNITNLNRYGNSDQLVMDNLGYKYQLNNEGEKINNKLLHVNEALRFVTIGSQVSSDIYNDDIEDQGLYDANDSTTWNYQYDELGNLIVDKAEEIEQITWTVGGKIKAIIRTATSKKPDLVFKYDAMGNRIMKLAKTKNQYGVLNGEEEWSSTWYVRDAQGNVMCTYNQKVELRETQANGNVYEDKLYAAEWPMYGSSRLGLKKPALGEAVYKGGTFQGFGKQSDGSYFRRMYFYEEDNGGLGPVGIGGTYTPPNYKGSLSTSHAGLKYYELSNHLGNVMSVVTDRKTVQISLIGPVGGNGTVFYQPDVLSATDYYPGGSIMPGRSFSSNSYRYGFNGMEKDDEVKGSGNSYDFGARIYDSRLNRWLSLDPLASKYPSMSPYNFVGNNFANYIDYDGRDFGYKIVHNEKGGTITIVATYYTVEENKAVAESAVNFWVGQNGKFSYQVKGDNGEVLNYDVKFELNVEVITPEDNDNRYSEAQGKAYDDPIGNSFLEFAGSLKGFDEKDKGITQEGQFIYLDPNKKDNATGRHEVGHTLGQPNHIGKYKNVQASGETRYPNAKEISTINIGKILSNFGLGSSDFQKSIQRKENESKPYGGSAVDMGSSGNAPGNFTDGKVVENP